MVAGIVDLPGEVLEKIFVYLCPYADYKNACLVCSWWRQVLHGVAHRRSKAFQTAIQQGRIRWKRLCKASKQAPTISDRYFHSTCYLDGALYVFGGCTASYTTFNDLWRFNLSTKEWTRVMANGTYPSPKSCATMVVWRNQLVVYGGWSHPNPYPFHQAPQFFPRLHIYHTERNEWTLVPSDPDQVPPGKASHTSCVIGDKMITFGGLKTHDASTNSLWEFDLLTHTWREMVVSGGTAPPRRYGASMSAVNDRQAVLLSGCGGPNSRYTDCWLLTLLDSSVEWTELEVINTENSCPSSLWCHPACKFGDSLVVLSKIITPIDPEVLARISRRSRRHRSKRLTVLPSYELVGSSSDEELRFEDLERNLERRAAANSNRKQMKRERQLKQLDKYQKLYDQVPMPQPAPQAANDKEAELLKDPMFLHTLDISTVSAGYVTWNAVNNVDVYGDVPEETYFYSLTEGRDELIMIGGVHPERSGMQPVRFVQAPNQARPPAQKLNTSVYSLRRSHLTPDPGRM